MNQHTREQAHTNTGSANQSLRDRAVRAYEVERAAQEAERALQVARREATLRGTLASRLADVLGVTVNPETVAATVSDFCYTRDSASVVLEGVTLGLVWDGEASDWTLVLRRTCRADAKHQPPAAWPRPITGLADLGRELAGPTRCFCGSDLD